MKPITLFSISFTLSLLITACGPSQAELDATATQAAVEQFATQTAEAPTFTPTATATATQTSTFTPTLTATPTQTFTPTPTSTPTHTPTATMTFTPQPTPTRIPPTQPPAAQCRLTSIVPVTGAATPSYNYRGEGFAPNDLVFVSLTDINTGDGSATFRSTNDQGQMEGNITWSLPGVPIPTTLYLTLDLAGCTARQVVMWP